ncbi:MFS transporter [Luteimicrobium subarcticum]|uniref:EmrB/QacA subfamily drug resistance transporter n=1 Tax=Luteimicrobium subarcticum TaxID=620910 RepID=A0A2M8WJC6_9MICO|nr:MFS transporter [Luteimicrobium subarcticum]PJI91022.1 EmrB/QacA subfamily drug resistance transporter [Luteimicrobium subarcticum]
MSASPLLPRPAAPTAAPRARSPRLVLAAILTTQLMIVLDATIVNVALPDMQKALDFTPSGLSWVLNAYTLAFGGLLLLGARAGDLLGRRRTLLIGISLFTLASLLGGFAQGSGELLAARAVQGVGAALAAPSGLALLMGRFPEGRERARALGYYAAVSIGGSAVGLIAGGLLTQWVSWRWVFFVNVPIGIGLVLLARAVLPETPRNRGRFDLLGAATSTLGMTSLVYGFIRAASDGWSDPTTVLAFVLGAVLLGTFVLVELRAAAPITPLRIFAHRTRSAALVARIMLVGGMMGMFFYLTLFLQNVFGYSPIQAGLAFLPLTAVLFAFSRISAALMTRVGLRPLLVGGLTVSTVALLVLSQLQADSSYVGVLVPLVLFGIGNGLAFVPLTAAALTEVEPQDAGAASGLVNATQQVGSSLGLAVLVTVGSAAATHARPVGASPAEVAQHAFVVGADRAFLVSALFLAASAVLLGLAVRPARARAAAPAAAPAASRVVAELADGPVIVAPEDASALFEEEMARAAVRPAEA